MRPGQDVAIFFACVFFLIIIWREAMWIKRLRSWKKTTGYVSGYWPDGEGGEGGPIIIYSKDSGDASFEAPYCLSNPGLGETVNVLHDPASDKAVLLTARHRWFISLLCLALFALMVFVAIKSH